MNDSAHHQQRMQRKKAVVDERKASAPHDRGVVVVTTGNGKGKSSSAFGMVARALGHGMKVGVVQFIKGREATGEELFFQRFPEEVEFHVTGDGFTWETQNRDADITTARRGWDLATGMLGSDAYDMVVLDELNIVLKHHYLPVEEVIEALHRRPAMQHVVITGRGAPDELLAQADTVTRMENEKHAFKAGVRAQRGIEL